MSSEFEDLLNRLLEQKPEISKSDIMDMIEKKKEKIGAGYLTDQGALFLIASDLGVALSEQLKVEMGLKDLYSGAKEITLVARVLNVFPARQFTRKDGSGQFQIRRMTVYDKDAAARVKLWDEKANIEGIEKLKPGDPVRIVKAYVKTDMAGNSEINVGSGGTIETEDVDISSVPPIEEITEDVSSIKENQQNIAVTGTLNGGIRTAEFTNFRGQPGKALHMRLKGKDGNTVRAVIWNIDESALPTKISAGARAKLIGVRTKMGQQGSLEIHGNEGTVIDIEGTSEGGDGQVQPLVVRILSAAKDEATDRPLLLAVDKNKHLLNVTDSTGFTGSFQKGQIVELLPSKIYGNSVFLESGSYARKLEEESEENIPDADEMRTKIKDIQPDESDSYCIEAIVLKSPEKREIQTKNGEIVELGEMFIEDDTGQIWLKAWRKQASTLTRFAQGEIIRAAGVIAKSGLEGRPELFLTPFSHVEIKSKGQQQSQQQSSQTNL